MRFSFGRSSDSFWLPLVCCRTFHGACIRSIWCGHRHNTRAKHWPLLWDSAREDISAKQVFSGAFFVRNPFSDVVAGQEYLKFFFSLNEVWLNDNNCMSLVLLSSATESWTSDTTSLYSLELQYDISSDYPMTQLLRPWWGGSPRSVQSLVWFQKEQVNSGAGFRISYRSLCSHHTITLYHTFHRQTIK